MKEMSYIRKVWKPFCFFLLLFGLLIAVVILQGRYIHYGETYMKKQTEEYDRDKEKIDEKAIEDEEDVRNLDKDRKIHVEILTDNFQEEYHKEVTITSEGGFSVCTVGKDGSLGADERRDYDSGKCFTVNPDGMKTGQVLCVESREDKTLILPDLQRSQDIPAYSGRFFLFCTQKGIILVNEVSLEEYLCSVVSSEMPSYYPEEAQKAQAVCARTYAWNHMKKKTEGRSYEELLGEWKEKMNDKILYDLNDGTEFQVYNNYRNTEQSRSAVAETWGECLDQEEIWYYSTSVGNDAADALQEEEAVYQFLMEEPEEGVEYGSPWLRWETELQEEEILANLKEYQGTELENIDGLNISRRSIEGQVTAIEIKGREDVVRIEGEYGIRRVLAPQSSEVFLRDGAVMDGMQMLPSAYFIFCERKEAKLLSQEMQGGVKSICTEDEQAADAMGHSYAIRGGGYGHGLGMSQYGAAGMAQSGSDYQEILEYYYGADVFEIY